MIRAFFANWGGAFADAARFARALPWLVAAMIGIEFAQHMIEVQAGFFSADKAVRKAASIDGLRMTFGWAKMLAVWGLAFVVIRYGMSGDAHAALRPSREALRRYAWVIVFQLIPTIAILYAEPIMAALGIPAGQLLTFRAVFGFAQLLLEPLLFLWFVHAAIGFDRYGPIASARTTRWLYLWALPLMFVTRTPLNALHGGFNTWPAGKGAELLWPMLAADALLVGAMVVVTAAVQVRIARFIVARREATMSAVQLSFSTHEALHGA